MENKKSDKKKPLKLSSSGRLQIRKNLGPSSNVKNTQQGSKKTIQIVFRNKNNQQKHIMQRSMETQQLGHHQCLSHT